NPLGYTFVGSNRWFYFGEKGWDIQGGFKVVNMNTTGGQKDYKRGMEQLSGTNPWGYQNKLNRVETWAKIGKVYIDKPYQSMGLQLSAIYHDQASNFGSTTYTAKQESYYANYIFQTIIKNSNHVIKVGGSFLADRYKENYRNKYFQRNEIVPGIFAGVRGDYNNLFGVFATPRLHFRYAPNEKLAIRASIGRAQRTANMLAENTGLMASNRDFYFNNELIQTSSFAKYPFKPEVAWNMGVNLTKKFLLNIILQTLPIKLL
ncbi:MAG TPA: TonB-dependent receptor, partial [Vicingus sp.]|nr:TonB-dependent receptor [Vicingus sp.]